RRRYIPDGIDGDRPIPGHQPFFDQRPHQRDEARGIAAGIGDAARLGDGGALLLRHLGEAIGPSRAGAMRGRRVDDAHRIALDEPHRLARGIVGQAEHHEVGAVQEVAPRRGLLAARGIDREEIEVAPSGEPPMDLQPGRAGLAVDEHLGSHPALQRTLDRKRALRCEPKRPTQKENFVRQRFENWKLRRALALPYFLRSTTRLSRVRKPCAFSTGRSSGSKLVSARLMPCRTAPAWPESPPPTTEQITSYWFSRLHTWNGWLSSMRSTGRAK